MIEVYTDGGCNIHSTSTGAWAFAVIKDGELIHASSGSESQTTNGRMEVTALYKALEFIYSKEYGKVTIFSDSKYCVNGYNLWMEGWEKNLWRKSNKKPVLHQDLWEGIFTYRRPEISVEWVKAHNGNKWNEFVDDLCTQGKIKHG